MVVASLLEELAAADAHGHVLWEPPGGGGGAWRRPAGSLSGQTWLTAFSTRERGGNLLSKLKFRKPASYTGDVHPETLRSHAVYGLQLDKVSRQDLAEESEPVLILRKGPPPDLAKEELKHLPFGERMKIKKKYCEAMKAYDLARLDHSIARLKDVERKATKKERMFFGKQKEHEEELGTVHGEENLSKRQENSVADTAKTESAQVDEIDTEIDATSQLVKLDEAHHRIEALDCGGPARKPMVSLESEQPASSISDPTPATLRDLSRRMLQEESPTTVTPDDNEYLRSAGDLSDEALPADIALQVGSREASMPAAALALFVGVPRPLLRPSLGPRAACTSSGRPLEPPFPTRPRARPRHFL